MDTYGRRLVIDLPLEVAVAELTEALRDEGLTVLGPFDVRAYLDRAVHHDFRRYVLLEAAVPHVVLDALREDLSVGAILPTTIAVFELADGETAVSVAEPFGGLAADWKWRQSSPKLAQFADETCRRLARALGLVEQSARSLKEIQEERRPEART